MIDRDARDRTAAAIRRYMCEKISAQELDRMLTETADATEDTLVRDVRMATWLDFDSTDDIPLLADKEQWDLYNRYLLLLDSDAAWKEGNSFRILNPFQAAAGLALAGYVVTLFLAGISLFLLLFGPLSMAIAWLSSRHRWKHGGAEERALFPFPTMMSLYRVRKSVPNYQKIPYHPIPLRRSMFNLIMERISQVLIIPEIAAVLALWCVFAPIVLFFQLWPWLEVGDAIELPE